MAAASPLRGDQHEDTRGAVAADGGRSPRAFVRAYAVLLGTLAMAFLGRVLGQVMAALYAPPWLPPMEEWYSGLLPYPVLLPIQILILGLQLEISRQLWRGRGPLTEVRPRLGAGLQWLSLVYFLAMVARYVVTMTLFPERRWLGGAIPIFFHWVLAAYLYLLSRHFRGAVRARLAARAAGGGN